MNLFLAVVLLLRSTHADADAVTTSSAMESVQTAGKMVVEQLASEAIVQAVEAVGEFLVRDDGSSPSLVSKEDEDIEFPAALVGDGNEILSVDEEKFMDATDGKFSNRPDGFADAVDNGDDAEDLLRDAFESQSESFEDSSGDDIDWESGWEDVSGNQGIEKKILIDGRGMTIPRGASVRAHYHGSLEDGTVFDSSYKRGEPLEFAVGNGDVIECWDEGFLTMKLGEKAVLKCRADYAYEKEGVPGSIPPKATLNFEVEIVGIQEGSGSPIRYHGPSANELANAAQEEAMATMAPVAPMTRQEIYEAKRNDQIKKQQELEDQQWEEYSRQRAADQEAFMQNQMAARAQNQLEQEQAEEESRQAAEDSQHYIKVGAAVFASAAAFITYTLYSAYEML